MSVSFCTFGVCVIVGYLTYYFLKWYKIFSYWKNRGLKNPTPIPGYGNGLTNYFKPRPQMEMDWYRQCGKIYGVYHMKRPALTVGEPELIKQILVKDFRLFRNRGKEGSVHPVLSKNLFHARDELWKRIRAIASPTFTSGKLRVLFPLINSCGKNFLEDFEEKLDKQSEFELKQLMGTYTMDVIARAAFASDTNTYKDPDNQFIKIADEKFNGPVWRTFVFESLPKFLQQNGTVRFFVQNLNTSMFFVNYAQKVINYRKENNVKHNDFLQLLMDAERTDEQTEDTNDANEAHHGNEGTDLQSANKEALSNVIEKKLTENEILAQCFLFFIAGYETTAATLSFCLYELAINPDIQQRLYEEIRQSIDENGEISFDVISKLPFLDSVLSETLRHYPPFPRVVRDASEDVMLGDTGIKVEKGMMVEIPVYAIHHDPEYFADPFVFNPDRFMPENRDQIKPYTYLPFGAGPRNCIGMRFALLESKLVLAKLLHKYKFSRIATTDVPVQFQTGRFFLRAKQLNVAIERR